MSGVYLRAFEMSDLCLINMLHNDPEINLLTGGQRRFVSPDYDKKWIEDKIFNNNTQVYCAICRKGIDYMCGYISLNDIDLINRNALWGGVVLGTEVRNRGYATQAAMQLLEYGFFELGLEKISGRWLTENKTSVFMAKLLGFVQEGVLRKEVFKNNQWYDVLVMSVLKEEFEYKLNNFKGNDNK